MHGELGAEVLEGGTRGGGLGGVEGDERCYSAETYEMTMGRRQQMTSAESAGSAAAASAKTGEYDVGDEF